MRTWRELWQSKSPISGEALVNRANFGTAKSKQRKQASFHWLNHLLNRDLPD
jgi:hypothetical protein